MTDGLCARMPSVIFNGQSGNLDKSCATILSVSSPAFQKDDMLIYKMSISGIAASAGSACTSGSNEASLVVAALNNQNMLPALRFSLSKYTSLEEVETTVEVLSKFA